MKKTLFLLLVLSIILVNGEGGFQFLYIDINPITSGMGNNGNTMTNDFFRNPALSLNRNYFSTFANHTEYFWQTRFEHLGFIIPSQIGNFGIETRGIYSNAIPLTESDVFDSTYYRYISAVLTINYAKEIFNDFKAGINIKPLYSSVHDYTAFGVLFDAGILYNISNDLSIGVSMDNIGINLKYNDVSYMPLLIKAGIGYSPIEQLKLVTDFNYYIAENSMIEAGLGIEYVIASILSIRTGYMYNSRNANILDNINGGLGIRIGSVIINYAASYNQNLGLVHIAGIEYNHLFTVQKKESQKRKMYAEMEKQFKEKEKMMSQMFINKAKTAFDNKDYESALENIDLALIWCPDSEEGRILSEMIEKSKKQWDMDKLLDLGIDYFINKDYINALTMFESILKQYPDNEKALKYKSMAEKEQEEILNKQEDNNKLNEGIIFYKNGKYIKAKKIFEQINNETGKQYLNKVNEKIGNIVYAGIKEVEKFIKKKHYISAVKKINALIVYNVELDKLNELRSNIETKSTSEVKVLLNNGIQYFNSKDYKKAEEYFQQVVIIDSTNKSAKDYLNKIKAFNIYSLEDLDKLYLKGIEAYTNNDYRIAVKYWEKCLEINPKYSKAIKNIEKAKKKIKELEN